MSRASRPQLCAAPAAGLPPLPDDAMVSIARFLNAKDLCSLECAARCFWLPEYTNCSLSVPVQVGDPPEPTGDVVLLPSAPLRWSMAEEAARLQLVALAADPRLSTQPWPHSARRMLWELDNLSAPVNFLHTNRHGVRRRADAGLSRRETRRYQTSLMMRSGVPMRAGRHFAEAVWRADCAAESGKAGVKPWLGVVDGSGAVRGVSPLQHGRALQSGDLVGLLLDADAGTLAVSVNGSQLHVHTGLTAPVLWAASGLSLCLEPTELVPQAAMEDTHRTADTETEAARQTGQPQSGDTAFDSESEGCELVPCAHREQQRATSTTTRNHPPQQRIALRSESRQGFMCCGSRRQPSSQPRQREPAQTC